MIAYGKLDQHGTFVADEVLAKHDEKYMPPKIAQSLKDQHEAAQPHGSAGQPGGS